MNEELITFSQNEYEVIKAFALDKVREDHYQDGNGIYRLSAMVTELGGRKIINKVNTEETKENIKLFINILKLLKIRPCRVYTDFDYLIIDWSPNGDQVVTSREEYLRLSLEFARYIDSITFCTMSVHTNSFDDDPQFNEDGDISNYINNYSPHFLEESFGCNLGGDIIVVDNLGRSM